MCGISIKARFHTMRTTGTHVTTTTLGELVRSFVPHPLPPAEPALTPQSCEAGVHKAEMALARLSGVAGLVPSVEWPLYSAIRKEALLTSQIEGTQATLTDLFDNEAGLGVANTDDVEEVSNYLRAFRLVRDNLHNPRGRSRCACCVTRIACCWTARTARASSRASCDARRTGSAAHALATRCSCHRLLSTWPRCHASPSNKCA